MKILDILCAVKEGERNEMRRTALEKKNSFS